MSNEKPTALPEDETPAAAGPLLSENDVHASVIARLSEVSTDTQTLMSRAQVLTGLAGNIKQVIDHLTAYADSLETMAQIDASHTANFWQRRPFPSRRPPSKGKVSISKTKVSFCPGRETPVGIRYALGRWCADERMSFRRRRMRPPMKPFPKNIRREINLSARCCANSSA